MHLTYPEEQVAFMKAALELMQRMVVGMNWLTGNRFGHTHTR